MQAQNDDVFVEEKDTKRIHQMMKRYRRCLKYYQPWRDEADEDYDYALGKQWSDEERAKHEDSKRPCLTFNHIKPTLEVIAGYQRENESRIKVSPEGAEDAVFSDVIDRVFKYIDKVSKTEYKLGYMHDGGDICGKSFIEGVINYDNDPVRGELDWLILSHKQVLVDPDCNEYDINKGEFVFKVCKYSRTRLAAMFPKAKSIIETISSDVDPDNPMSEGDEDNYGIEPNRTTVARNESVDERDDEKDELLTLVEEWYKKYVTKFFVVDRASEDNDIVTFNTKDEATAFAEQQGGGEVFERQVKEIWVSSAINGKLIQDVKSPLEPHYPGFPIFRYLAKWTPSSDNEVIKIQGYVRALKDPQYEKNKAHSQALHILNTTANTGWIADESAMTDEAFRQLQNMGSVPGVVVRKRDGSDIREIAPKGDTAIGMFSREGIANEEFKLCSGINADMLAQQDKTTSGRAISLRIKQAVTILAPQFMNYRYTKELVGKFILQIVPILFDSNKMKKVLGTAYLANIKSEKYPEGLTDGVLNAFLALVKNNKYDVDISEMGRANTMRAEIFEQLVELAKTAVGQFIPPELIVEYMDLPNANEVKGAISQQRQAMMSMQAAQSQPKG